MIWEMKEVAPGLIQYSYKQTGIVIVDEMQCTIESRMGNERKNFTPMEPNFRYKSVANVLRSVAASVDKMQEA